MKRLFPIFLFLTFALSTAHAADVIGLVLPLTGRFEAVGKRMEFGAQLAVKKLSESGRNIELVTIDDGCDIQRVADIGKQLREAGAKIVVGPICFKSAQGLTKNLNSDRDLPTPVPVIATNTRNRLLERLREVDELPLYTLSNSHDAEARAVVDLIIPQFGGRPFAILDDGSVYGRALSDDVRLMSEQAGVKAIISTNFRPLQNTQISLLRRLKKSGVEAVFIAAAAEDVATIANDMKSLQLDWTLATGERGALLPYVGARGTALDGVLMVREASLETRDDNLVEQSVLLGHALVEIGAEAIRGDVGDLAGKTFETIIGPVKFGANGRASPAGIELQRWENGAFEAVVRN